MKTITATFHYGTNYGAVLQTYALHKTILKLGHENYVIDTIQTKQNKIKRKSLYHIMSDTYVEALNILRYKEITRLKKSFAEFKKKYINLTKPYSSMEELRADPFISNADCLIVGSDQVWKLSSRPEMVDSRLLLFGPKNSIRFSYAASLEEQNYTEDEKIYVKCALDSFRGIGVREESACKYIESFTNRQCVRVADPVFLLTQEEWFSISANPRLKGPYILCYQVQRNKRMEEVAYSLKVKTGYPIVSICKDSIRWMKSDYYFHDVSLEEFIGFYKNANYVVSASFHGVAMGLVFNKPVYAMVKNARSTRLRNVMEIMGLNKFIVNQESNEQIYMYEEKDILRYKSICEKERKNGLNYLRNMLV